MKSYILYKELECFTNANCWTHTKRFFSDAVKAMGKSDATVRLSTYFQALTRIAAIYKLEEALKDLSSEERLKEGQKNIRSLVEEYFVWTKALMPGMTVLPKGKTVQGLNYDYFGGFIDTCPEFERHHSGASESSASSLFHGALDMSLRRSRFSGKALEEERYLIV